MNRNANARFSQVPLDLDIQRSRFDRSHGHKTTFNTGELIPIFLDEVLPGDTFDMQTNMVCRMSTPIFPVMDNAYLDTYFFFVPNRLIWDHWEAFNGQNDESYWTQPVEYNVPHITNPGYPDDKHGWDKGSLADYFGLPTNSALPYTVSALPFRAYVKIWNDWFRDQNTMNPAYFSKDDSNRVGKLRSDYDSLDGGIESAFYGGRPLQVSKFHDYFTSALPQPQKGPGVEIVPSITGPYNMGSEASGNLRAYIPITTQPWQDVNLSAIKNNKMVFATSGSETLSSNFAKDLVVHGLGTNTPDNIRGIGAAELIAKASESYSTEGVTGPIPVNLVADMDNLKISMLVNDVRLAFQLQKLYEKDARGGTRYIEVLKAHFGVDSPDGRLQRSEYLGGSRTPININQVLQNSATSTDGEGSPLGTTGAYSLTSRTEDSFVKSFTEHGWIIGLCCVRTAQSYQQGINKMWSRQRRFDFYWPTLANIGEQPILKRELYMPEDGNVRDLVASETAFGYQEAWADYRYHPNIISGAFRSNVEGSLDAWHYGNDFSGDVNNYVISEDFLYQDAQGVDRTLAVQSSLEDQFIADFFFHCYTTRPMPLYSVPGLVDHH